jgi:hypothetical protein
MQTMTVEEYRNKYPTSIPKKAWFQPKKSTTMKVEGPESALQKYANDAITLRGWTYIRFETALLGWIKRNAPGWVQGSFFHQVAGKLPDNFLLIPLGGGCFFGVKLELKTQDKKGRAVGKLHGRQKKYAEAEGWYIARSPEQIKSVLDEIEKKVQKIK